MTPSLQQVLQRHYKWLFSIVLTIITIAFVFTVGLGLSKYGIKLTDPEILGHHLLEKRIARCPEIIQDMLAAPVYCKMQELPLHFTVTGIGSSEAHGKFFVHLINRYTLSSANFLQLSNFYTALPEIPKEKESVLVVFSQGLSPNSSLAISQRHAFKHIILFTSLTPSSSQNTNANLIQTLKAEGTTIIQFPLENEHSLLIRVVGPLAGYLAAIQFVDQNWPKSIPACNNTDLLCAIKNAQSNTPKNLSILNEMKKGSVLLMPSPLCDYSQNLAYKFLEGLFLPIPSIVDYLGFNHGYFQQLIHNPMPIIIFKENTFESQLLYSHAKSMLDTTQSKILEISSNLPPPWNILEYEAIINHLIFDGIHKWKINQIAWPGKGKKLDHHLYNIRDPRS